MKDSRRALWAASMVWLALPAIGQIRSNATVHGSYYVRYLGANTSVKPRTLISFQGILTFDGCTGSGGEGKYGTMEFPNGSAIATRKTFFPMTADGKGGLGNLAVKGAALDNNNTTTPYREIDTSDAGTAMVSIPIGQ